MTARRVVVTGMGMLSPVGNNVATSWDAVCRGQSGIFPIEHFDASAYATRFGGVIRDFDAGEALGVREARRMDPFVQYGMVAGMQALEDAGLEVEETQAERIGVAIGSGIGGIGTIERNSNIIRTDGPRRVSPLLIPSAIVNMVAGNLSIRYGIKGPNLAVTTACTTGAHNIGLGARLIRWGDADVMLVGGAEMATTPVGVAGFCAARALSSRNDDPQRASRPWDVDRDGFVLSDGAAILVLEEYEFARRRGARIYAELVGFGMSADASHITLPAPEGAGAQHSMRMALADAEMEPGKVDYINAHATSTRAGDVNESIAIERVFDRHARELAVSSTKSMTGHMLGAAGAAEAVFSVLAIQDGIAPPTINLDKPDEDCNLDFVPGEAQRRKIDVSLSNSFGFGGTNASLIFRRLP